MKVTILERSPGVWRLRTETLDSVTGKRMFAYQTVKGSRDVAERCRATILSTADKGTAWVQPDTSTSPKGSKGVLQRTVARLVDAHGIFDVADALIRVAGRQGVSVDVRFVPPRVCDGRPPVERVARAYGVDPADIVRRDDAK